MLCKLTSDVRETLIRLAVNHSTMKLLDIGACNLIRRTISFTLHNREKNFLVTVALKSKIYSLHLVIRYKKRVLQVLVLVRKNHLSYSNVIRKLVDIQDTNITF